MRIIVVGLGVQGAKRQKIAGAECIATVDPVNPAAQYKTIQEVAVNSYDAVLLCIPDEPKYDLIKFALTHKKHVLVEKPLWCATAEQIHELKQLAKSQCVVLYTAYNHRFEPHYVRMKELIDSGVLGKIYHCRMFYGNGTARLVRESAWRDTGAGVLPDLGSHLLDTLHFWFGQQLRERQFKLLSSQRFENKAPDHVIFADFNSDLTLEAEMTLLSWRNHFTCDVFAELGSAHIRSLCKWGPSSFVHRKRLLPSGRPVETETVLVQEDPTWALEYTHFKKLCAEPALAPDAQVDGWIYDTLEGLSYGSRVGTATSAAQPGMGIATIPA